MTGHYKEICERCDTMISQCRCPDPNKSIRFGICANCDIADKIMDEYCKETNFTIGASRSALRRFITWQIQKDKK